MAIPSAAGGTSPGTGSETAVQSDTIFLGALAAGRAATYVYRSLYVTTAGTVKFTGVNGIEDTWTVTDGFLIPVAMKQVWSTGTTATGLKGIL